MSGKLIGAPDMAFQSDSSQGGCGSSAERQNDVGGCRIAASPEAQK